MTLVILGCGYTGQRVARRFLDRGARVAVTTRNPQRLRDLGVEIVAMSGLAELMNPETVVLHSIPPHGPPDGPTHGPPDGPPHGPPDGPPHGPPDGPDLLDALRKCARVVYLSSTAVYGAATTVNEHTPADPSTERARARLEVEQAIAEGPWSSLILRPAAIYGPGRGVQESIQRGEHSLSDRFVSRIHVDDLAAHAEAALLSTIQGAYPVADEEPCSSREIAEFCAGLLSLPVGGANQETANRTPRYAGNRRVDGSAIRRALGLTLKYPSYRTGVPAALACGLET